MKLKALTSLTLVATLATAVPAHASDVLVAATGTVLSTSYSSGPFAAATAGDTAQLTCWVTTPGTVVTPGQYENYPIDVPNFAVTVAGGSVSLSAMSHNLGIQNDFPVADGVRLFQTQTDQPGMWIIFELSDSTGTLFHSTDITQNAGNWGQSQFSGLTWEFFGGGGDMSILLDTLTVYPPGGPVGSEYCAPAVSNTTGSPGTIAGFGSLVAADNVLALTASDLPDNQFGYFLASLTQGFNPMPGGSAGNLCLSGTIARFSSQIQNSGSSGAFSIAVDLTQIPLNPAVAVAPGETWNFQAWYRDPLPGGPTTSNFTSALSITYQ